MFQSKQGLVIAFAAGCGGVMVFVMMIGLFVIAFQANMHPELFAEPKVSPSGNYGTSGGELANADALTEDQIRKILKAHPNGYNLLPYAKQIHDAGHMFNINPLFSLAIANKDSSLGTAGAGRTCRNPGNMEYRSHKFKDSGAPALGNCSSVYGGSGRWAAFKTYGDGMQAKMWLLRKHYLDEGLTDLHSIINKYCPPSKCDVDQYVADIESFMRKYGKLAN